MNKDEYGQVLYVNVGQDLTGSTLTLVLQPEQGETLELQSGVEIGVTPITVNGTLFNANEYATYTVKEGDLSYAGRWRMKLKVKFSATKELSTDFQNFVVKE